VPAALSDLVLRLLAKDPAGRPPSARAVADALRSVAATPAAAPRKTRRRALALAAAALLILAGGGLLAQQIIIRIKTKDGETEIKAPPGAGVVVEKDGKKVAEVPAEGDRPMPEPAAKPPEGDRPKPEPAAPPKPEPAAAKPEPAPTRSGEPMSPLALVGRPAEIKGLRSWTVETRGHRGAVYALDCSPDGKWLASAGSDGTIRVWDVAARRLVRALVGHTAPVRALAWSHDGKTLASAGDDKAVRLWDAAGQVRLLAGHTEPAFAAAWSPDGKMLATASRDNTVRLWETGSGELLFTLRGHDGLSAVAWLPDGKRLLTAGTDKQLLLWSADTGAQVYALRAGNGSGQLALGAVSALAVAPDGKRLVTAESGSNVMLRQWDGLGGPAHSLAPGPAFKCNGLGGPLAWAPDGKRLADAPGSELRVWQPEVEMPVHLLTGQPGQLQAFAWLADSKSVAGGDHQGNVVLWNANSEQLVHTFASAIDRAAEETLPEGNASWSPDGKALAIGDGVGKVRLWRFDPARLVATFQEDGPAFAPAWSPDGQTLATAAWKEGPTVIRLWDVASGQPRCELRGHTKGVSALAWSPDGKTVASDGWGENTLRLWDAATGKELRSLPAAGKPIWSPDGKRLACLGGDKAVHLWEAATGKELRTFPVGHEHSDLAFGPDGKTLAVDSYDNNGAALQLWDVDSGRLLRTLPEPLYGSKGLAWLPDGKTLVAQHEVSFWSDKPELAFWDTGTGRRRTVPLPADGALSPDRRFLASTAANPARLWEVDGGRPLGALLLLRDSGWLALGPGGHYHASPGAGREPVYVVQTDQGQEALPPEEFAKKYGWTNDPERARLPGN
jgi:WD40 repeat protein